MLLSSVLTEFISRFMQAFSTSVLEVVTQPVNIGIIALGTAILYLWHVYYDGPRALNRAPVRRTRITPFFSLALVFVYFLSAGAVAQGLAMVFRHDMKSAAAKTALYGSLVLLEILLTAGMLVVARHTFARRLRGIGLNPATLPKDLRWAPVHLAAVYPLVLAGLWLVLFAGRVFEGTDYTVQHHESLQTLTEADSALLQWLIPVFAVLIVPVFEELLFRGFVQSSISAWTGRPWLAIATTSLLFSAVHPNLQHCIGLFFLSCGFGYAYERSGSLFRPIIMHLLFNGLNVTMALIQQSLQNA